MFCQDTVSIPYAEQAVFANGGRGRQGTAWLRGPVIGYQFCHVHVYGYPPLNDGEQKPATVFASRFGGSWKKCPLFASSDPNPHVEMCTQKEKAGQFVGKACFC